jgi:hypothetical protein
MTGPFDLDEVPAHAVVAREAVEGAALPRWARRRQLSATHSVHGVRAHGGCRDVDIPAVGPRPPRRSPVRCGARRPPSDLRLDDVGRSGARRRPFAAPEELYAAALAALTTNDLAQAMAGHPPIGRPRPGKAASAREQSGMTRACADLKAEMHALNQASSARSAMCS